MSHPPPGLPGTIARTAISLTFTAAALAAWLWVLMFTRLPWYAATATGAAVLLGLLYSMIRIGGMGRCLACGRVIPALWGSASYCRADATRVDRLAGQAHQVTAMLRLIGLHGPEAVQALVERYGQGIVNRVALHGVGALPESASERERREVRAFLGHQPVTSAGPNQPATEVRR